jgi:N-acyl-D-amino-acid deacylase
MTVRRYDGMTAVVIALVLSACVSVRVTGGTQYDTIIRHGTVYDGSGRPGGVADLAIQGDSIAAIGDLSAAHAAREIEARGLAVAPGFINMMDHSEDALIADGRAQSAIRQGVTLAVMGEGETPGPLTPEIRKVMLDLQGDIKYPIEWNTLGEYLEYLEERGISTNVASLVGATTIRENVLGYADRAPTPDELARMQALVRQAMEEGALGVGSALIYAPGFYAKTDELVALMKAAAPYGGIYASHMRSEGNRLLEGVDELLTIARESGAPAEIYHLKAAGVPNWGKLPAVIAKVDSARRAGAHITADMYTYIAGATGLDASMPPWVQEGGYRAWAERLKDPAIRARVAKEMKEPTDQWENFFYGVGSPDKILLLSFKNPKLKPLTGKTLAEVARMRGKPAEEVAMDLVIEDGTRVGVAYFLMSEDNVRREVQIPWVSFGADEAALAPEPPFTLSNVHPRAYGNFARFLGKYVRDEKLVPMSESIRRLAALPAENLKLKRRGKLVPGYFADVVVFDPARIEDHATFEKPHQYSTGVLHVFVNGTQVLRDGEHTGAKPGRFVRGPGWTGWRR